MFKKCFIRYYKTTDGLNYKTVRQAKIMPKLVLKVLHSPRNPQANFGCRGIRGIVKPPPRTSSYNAHPLYTKEYHSVYF